MRFHVPLRLRWSDLDAYNHVNNSTVLSLLEEARVRAFWTDHAGALGEPSPLAVIDGAAGNEVMTLIARQEVEYLAPIPYQSAPLDIQLWIGHIGGASAEVYYEIWNPTTAAERVRYTVAETTIVFVDAESGRPSRIGEAARTAWEPYLEPPIRFRGTKGKA